MYNNFAKTAKKKDAYRKRKIHKTILIYLLIFPLTLFDKYFLFVSLRNYDHHTTVTIIIWPLRSLAA